MIRKFECTVTREDKYIIEIDDEIINQEWLDEFSKCFYKCDDLKEHAEQLAKMRVMLKNKYYEGYGILLVNDKIPPLADGNRVEKGINIIIISENEDCEVDCYEI